MSGLTTHRVCQVLRAGFALIAVAMSLCGVRAAAQSSNVADPLPAPATAADAAAENGRISISADYSRQWVEERTTLTVLRGRCRIVQGETTLTARQMVIWQETADESPQTRLTVYLEDDVRIDRPGSTVNNSTMLVELVGPDVGYESQRQMDGAPTEGDALFQRAQQRRQTARRGMLLQTQMTVPDDSDPAAEPHTVQLQPPPGSQRRVLIFPRSEVAPNFLSVRSQTTPPEQITLVDGGINVLIDGLGNENANQLLQGPVGTVDLSADRAVIWSPVPEGDEPGTSGLGTTVQSRDAPYTVYLEGNIIIRQGETVVKADRALYDAQADRALILNAELRSFVPQMNAAVRLRAERLRQISRNRFFAKRAWTTTSTYGKPGFRLQASEVVIDQRIKQPLFGIGGPELDPLTGAPAVEPTPYITSRNNTLRVGDLPVFYSPYFSAPAEDPQIPLKRAIVATDRVFGFRVETVLDAFQLLGIEEPSGVDLSLLANYYSERGPALGAMGKYGGSELFGIPGRYSGEGKLLYVNDSGKDNLGLDRRSVELETQNRYRALLRHRQDLPADATILGELGLVSDRNFLEQYYEREFDREKDQETLLYGKQRVDNWAWSLLGRVQTNDFENNTQWLPRADLYGLSEPLFEGLLTWSSHSSAGYGDLEPARPPSDPADVFTPLPFVADVQGTVLMTRHELDMPLSLGPINITPYVMGEAAFWGQDLNGEQADRLLSSAGIRSSMLVWRAYPYVQSRIVHLTGLAHKMVFEADSAATDVTKHLGTVAQYNEFDDDAQERFRQRLVMNTFGGTLPAVFDPRFYAVRTGAGYSVMAPYYELVDDQQVARLAWRQRLQTKTGPPERLRVRDWMTLDLEASYFPNQNRDNFGEEFGLLGGRYTWNVGDRTQLFASAFYDVFDDAQQLWNAGILTQRGDRGSTYVGIRQVKGAGLESQILTFSYSYQMSPKWISTIGTAYDIAEARNRGQSLTISRIGADFNVHIGANLDPSKASTGIGISLEPRFLGGLNTSLTQLSSLVGGNRRQ